MFRKLGCFLIALSLPSSALADVEWAAWSGFPVHTGTFASSGQVVTLTPAGALTGSSIAEGTAFTCDKDVPGIGGNGNPPFQQFLSATTGGAPTDTDDFVADIELPALPAGASPILGLTDQKFAYRMRLYDDQDQPIPVPVLVAVAFNILYDDSFVQGGLIADQNTWVDGDVLRRDNFNDAIPTNFYGQTGLSLVPGLPAGTRRIRLEAAAPGEGEGLSLSIGIDYGTRVRITDTSGSPGDHAVDFASITVGASSITHVVTLENPNDAPIDVAVGEPGQGGSDFDVVDGCSGELGPGASCQVTLVFHPTGTGDVDQQLVFTIDGTLVEPVAVAGAGTAARTGDANGDGSTKAADALLVLQAAVGSGGGAPGIPAACDMNGDSKITAGDALAVLRKAVGL